MSIIEMYGIIKAKIGCMIGRGRREDGTADERTVFDEAAFQAREPYRCNYKLISDVLCDLIRFDTVLDLGCANGFLMEPMMASGKDVVGVEVSAAIKSLLSPRIRERVLIEDATKLGKIGDFDLVACIEVAEHIEPGESGSLIDTIVSNSRQWVYFTAASPYQGGHGHINCRPHFYWMNEFHKRGFALEWKLTEQLIDGLGDLHPAEWLPKNSMIFSRR